MKRLIAAMLVMILAGCKERMASFAAYRDPKDALISLFPVFGYPCASVEKFDDVKFVASKPTDECFKMEKPRRFRGIWIDEFEGSTFYEGITSVSAAKRRMASNSAAPDSKVEWLTWHRGNRVPELTSRVVLIDFVGRRTAYPGHYGHMGGSDSEIIVDRMIFAREIYRSKEAYLVNEIGS